MLKANDPLIAGIEFTIGGEAYTAAPLTLGGIKAVLPRLSANAAEVLSTVLCVSLKRNYAEVSQPWLDEHMTGGEFRAASGRLAELMRMSGLSQVAEGDNKEDDQGEAAAAA